MKGVDGSFVFTANETASFQLSFTVDRVEVSGDQGNSNRIITNNTEITVNQSDKVVIVWRIMIQPLLPYMFILGMIGLLSMFGGLMYPIALYRKEHDIVEAIKKFCIFFFLGLGLFMAWLFAV